MKHLKGQQFLLTETCITHPARRSKFTKSSLFLKTMISDFLLSSGVFLNQNPTNKPAKNNKRIFVGAVFHFVDPVQKYG